MQYTEKFFLCRSSFTDAKTDVSAKFKLTIPEILIPSPLLRSKLDCIPANCFWVSGRSCQNVCEIKLLQGRTMSRALHSRLSISSERQTVGMRYYSGWKRFLQMGNKTSGSFCIASET